MVALDREVDLQARLTPSKERTTVSTIASTPDRPSVTEILSELRELRSEVADLKRKATKAAAPVLDGLITPAVLSARIGQTERTLSEWRITGNGPAYIRVGRGVRYRPEAVDAWLLSRERTSTADEY